MIAAIAFLLLLFMLPAPAWAACDAPSGITRNAPTWDDVAACHTAATNGDTITVSAGSYTVTATTTLTKYVKLVASGTVTLTDNVANGSNLLAITESTAGSTRIQGFTIVQGTGVHANPIGVFKISSTAGGQPVLVTGNTYTNIGASGDWMIWGSNQGVIWGNTHTGFPSGGNCNGNSSTLRHKPTSDTTSWTRASNFGTADTTGNENLYFEGNTVLRVAEAIDVDTFGRLVVRYNTFSNHGPISHGVDTSGPNGGRSIQIYNNTFTVDNSPIAACSGLDENRNGFIYLRGGTALIHNNVLPDPSNGTWGTKFAVTFTYENLRRNAGGFPCWDTTTAPGAGYPAPQQPGWGYVTGTTTVTGSNCSNCPMSQDIEPIYLWDNTGTGNYGNPAISNYPVNECGGSAPLVSTYIQANRDFFTATAKPSYTPYTYPHPLTLSAAANSSISGGVQLQGGATIK